MKHFHSSLLAAALLVPGLALATVPGEVLINEAMITGVSTDDREFVELIGPASHDLSDLELVLFNGSNATSYRTVDLAGQTIPADGFFVISGNNTLVPETDLVGLAVTNAIQNGDPDSIVLRRKADTVVIDALGYFAIHDLGTPGLGVTLVDGTHFLGSPTGLGGDDAWPTQTGTGARVAPATVVGSPNTHASIGRFPDGTNTNDNYTDFNTLFAVTPGASNAGAPTLALPITEDFSQATGLASNWAPSFTPMILETAATAVPASIPNSPDTVTPGEWVSVKDNTGGGDGAGIIGIGTDYDVTVYAFNATTALPEFAGVVTRLNILQNNTSFNFDQDSNLDTDFGSNYGDRYYGITVDMANNTATAHKVLKGIRTVVGTPASITDAAWAKLRVICDGDVVTFEVNDVEIGSLSGETVVPGYIALGYYEADATTGSVRANYDALSITAPVTSSVADWTLLN